jgi:hypothetical protein
VVFMTGPAARDADAITALGNAGVVAHSNSE